MTDEQSAVSPDNASLPDNAKSPGDADSEQTQATPAGTSGNSPAQDSAPPTAEQTQSDDSARPATAESEVAKPAGDPQRHNIQIGSRRGGGKKQLPSKPMLGKADPSDSSAPIPSGKVPTPSVRTPLSAEVQQALDDAIADLTVEDLMTAEATNNAAQEIELESRRKGTIVRAHGDNVFFSIGGRNEGVASLRQFKEPPNIGAEMEVVVKSFQADDGLYEVTIPGASVSVADWSDLIEGAVVEARITGANTGGLECMVSQIRGFIPASQIGLFRVEDFAEYIGQKLECVATEVNERKRNLVLSHRAYLERERQEARQKLLDTLEPGLVLEGVVSNLRDFGAFVDIGGIDGLIHISQISWDRVNHPSDVLTVGQRIRVRVEKINPDTGKIGLSYRELLEHPWTNIESEISVGSTVRGPVTRNAKFGAFVKLAPGVEGLIHISELAHHRVRSVADVVKEGQDVEVKVLSIDTDAQRIGLSLKATQPEPEKSEAAEQPDEVATPTVSQSSKPLKGGFDRPTGGESIGLKW